MNWETILIAENKRKPKPPDESKLGFGQYFTDHIFTMRYKEGQGWGEAKIEPYRTLELDPAGLVFHYGQSVFEGLKAYYGKDGGIFLFRPQDYLKRLNRSADRLCMPKIDVEFVHQALKALVLADKDWLPRSPGSSMYIRPTMIASEASLGVKVSSEYLFFIILGPAGAYYPEGFNPIKIYVCDQFVRAVMGGVGDCKTSGNYAASLYAAEEAHSLGFRQVLWLDALERKYVEEVGTMNIFFLFKDKLITPPLTGSILPGMTRDSVIKLAKHWKLDVEERRIGIDEVLDGIGSGKLQEVFGTGTAAIISPVGELYYQGKTFTVADGKTGALSQKLYQEILDLQYGHRKDPFNWVEKIG